MNWGYAVLMGCALLLGWAISQRTQQSLQLPWTTRLGIAWGGVVAAMVAAKLPYLFNDWDALVDGSAWFVSGKTILMGLVGGYLGVEASKWALGVTQSTGDSFVLPVASAIAIGRLGCFYAGCCFGTPTELPWAVTFPQIDLQPRHPTQLYEFVFHAAMVGWFWYSQQRQWFVGHQFKLYVICYAGYRWLSEFVRPEAKWLWGGTAYQWGSLAILVLFVGLWIKSTRPQ